MVYFTVYKTTCLANGKTYIGQHKTSDINDGYLGSGTALSQAIEKYGRVAFHKEILYLASSQEDMDAKEAELVTEEFVQRTDNYNLIPGGTSGPDFTKYKWIKNSNQSKRIPIEEDIPPGWVLGRHKHWKSHDGGWPARDPDSFFDYRNPSQNFKMRTHT